MIASPSTRRLPKTLLRFSLAQRGFLNSKFVRDYSPTESDLENIKLKSGWSAFSLDRLSAPFRDYDKFAKFSDRLLQKTDDAQTLEGDDPAPFAMQATGTSVYMGIMT